MIKKSKKISLVFLVLGVIVMYCSFAAAAGVAIMSQYGKNNPLIVAPGEEEILKVEIMSIGSDEKDLTVRAELVDDQGIASFVDSNLDYELPYAQAVPVNVRVKIPAGAAENTDYMLEFKFTDITPLEQAGTVSLGMSFRTSIAVKAQTPATPAPPTPPTPPAEGMGTGWIVAIVVLIILIAVVIYFIYKKKR